MSKLSRDLAAPVGGTAVLHPRETVFLSGNLGALNAEVIVPADGAASLALDLRGTFNMTIEVAGTVDGTNWTLIPVRPLNLAGLQYVAAVTGSTAGTWVGKCAPFRSIRARVTAYTSGAAVAVLAADTAVLDDSLQGTVAPLYQTLTGAAGAAVTLSLAAPGAGLRQYITFLRIMRSASAALTAGAAPTVVTTTNLPGAMAFSFGADAAAQGTDKLISEDFAYAVPASAQNTAVTIVCPVTTGVIWRASAGYYVAP
jgi:hypothetical protein